MNHFPDVSIIVPTYREVENLKELIQRLDAAVTAANLSAEMIIVDDNSGDGTIELCKTLALTFPVRLVTRTNERGLATAVIRGLHEARADLLLVMDADLSHPPDAVPKLLKPLQNGDADFVIGSRYVTGGSVDEAWSFFRYVNSKFATLLAVGLTSAKDPMAGFFAIRRDSLVDLSTLNPCGYKIGLELMVRCNCRHVAEVPIRFEDRKAGESKLNLKEQWLYIQHLVRLYAFRYPTVLGTGISAAVFAGRSLAQVFNLITFRSQHSPAQAATDTRRTTDVQLDDQPNILRLERSTPTNVDGSAEQRQAA